MKTIQQLKQGCGNYNSLGLNGGFKCEPKRLCLSCKAKLKILEEVAEEIRKLVPYHYQRLINGELEEDYFYTEEDIKRLLSKINGVKE